MNFLRSLIADQIKKSLISGIKQNTSEVEFLQVQPKLEQFLHPITENNEFILSWFADGTLISVFKNQQTSSNNDETFAILLWSIGFDDDFVVKKRL